MIPESVYQQLPEFFKKACSHYNGRQRDVFFTGLLTAISGCLFNVSGIYHRKKVYSTLFSFNLAPAASGKGVLADVKHVIYPLHDLLSQPLTYAEPIRLLIPGDISTAMILELLNYNEGIGVMIESEADTVGNTLKQDYGKMDDKLRLIFHHEPLACARKGNKEYFEIKNPQMSFAISGTFSQLRGIIPSKENGLFSRFLFYGFEQECEWLDQAENEDAFDLKEIMKGYGLDLVTIYRYYKEHPRTFSMTGSQTGRFNAFFKEMLTRIKQENGSEALGSITRMGLITFRIAMILSALRYFEVQNDDKILCTNQDFDIALELARTYIVHLQAVLEFMPEENEAIRGNKHSFFNALPTEFKREDVLELAVEHYLPTRTMDRLLKELVNKRRLIQVSRGHFKKQ